MNNLRMKNFKRLIFVHININSINELMELKVKLMCSWCLKRKLTTLFHTWFLHVQARQQRIRWWYFGIFTRGYHNTLRNWILLLWEIEITFPVFLLCLHVKNFSQRYFLSLVDPLLCAAVHSVLTPARLKFCLKKANSLKSTL